MRTPIVSRARTLILGTTLSFTLGACAELNDILAPRDLAPMQPTTWHAHVVAGQALPAVVQAHFGEGVVDELTLDSLQVRVGANGGWEQWAWLRRARSDGYSERTVQLEFGQWEQNDDGYLFYGEDGQPRFLLRDPARAEIGIDVLVEGLGGTLSAILRRSPPPTASVR